MELLSVAAYPKSPGFPRDFVKVDYAACHDVPLQTPGATSLKLGLNPAAKVLDRVTDNAGKTHRERIQQHADAETALLIGRQV